MTQIMFASFQCDLVAQSKAVTRIYFWGCWGYNEARRAEARGSKGRCRVLGKEAASPRNRFWCISKLVESILWCYL